MRRIANDSGLRESMGRAAQERAAEFTWEKVGRRRREQLKRALGGLNGPGAYA